MFYARNLGAQRLRGLGDEPGRRRGFHPRRGKSYGGVQLSLHTGRDSGPLHGPRGPAGADIPGSVPLRGRGLCGSRAALQVGEGPGAFGPGFRRVYVSRTDHTGLLTWPPGEHPVGIDISYLLEMRHLVQSISTGARLSPDWADCQDGLQVERICEALEQSCCSGGGSVKIVSRVSHHDRTEIIRFSDTMDFLGKAGK